MKTPMRIIQLGPYAPPHGGVQANLAAIRQALLERGIHCDVIAIARSENAKAEVGVYRPAGALKLIWLLIRLRYDILHLHIGGNLTTRLLMLTLFCSLMPRSKSVLTFHSGGYPGSEKGRTARAHTLRGFVFRRLDRIIAVNDEIALMFEKFGVESQRIRVIAPHVITGPAPGTQLPRQYQDFRKSHEHLLITVSGLEKEYDLPTEIESLGLVRERFPQAGLVIIGAGSLENGIRDLIKSKAYAEHIFLCGDVAHSVALSMVANSDLFLRTTLYDGDSISVREALYLGIPVIATDTAMRPEGVDLVPAADPIALNQAIEKRLLNPGAHVPPGESGQENIKAVMDLYQELKQE